MRHPLTSLSTSLAVAVLGSFGGNRPIPGRDFTPYWLAACQRTVVCRVISSTVDIRGLPVLSEVKRD